MDWNPRYLYLKLFNGDEQAVEDFLAEIDFFTWNQQQDAGRPFSEAVAELCAMHPQHCDPIRAYDTRYPESLSGPIQPTVDILRRLKDNGDTLYALSNWPAEKFRQVRSDYPFFNWFDKIIISGEVGLAKPDPRIFELLVERTSSLPQECLFIDDSQDNIDTASSIGFQTILFKDPSQLQLELSQRGLLT